MISPVEVQKYLKSTQTDGIQYSLKKGKEISYVEDHSTTTLEEALCILEKNNYVVGNAIKEIKKEGKFWCSTKPDLSKHWSNLEVVLFELGMTTDPKNFIEIQRKIGTKTLQEVVHFYWYWRTTNNYKEWRKKDRQCAEAAKKKTHYFNQLAQLNDGKKDYDPNRNPRLRRRPRVDYSYSNFMPKFKESDSRASSSSAKGQEVVEGEVYDLRVLNVSVFADICLPGELEERSGEESDEQESGEEESEESYEEEESDKESESDEEVKTEEEEEDKNQRGLKRRCSSGKISDT